MYKAFERITIVIDSPKTINDDSSQPVIFREFTECDRFANELQAHTLAKVTIVEHYPQTVLPTEFILLFTGSLDKANLEFLTKFKKQIIVMDAGAAGGFDELHKYGFAGVVGERLFWYWLWDRGVYIIPCFLGLTVVAKEMKAGIIREIGAYCDMTDDVTSPKLLTLPVLLLRYLETYNKMLAKMTG